MRNQYEKQEKVLWYAQIMIFLGVLATWFNHMDMHTFYTINIILSVISIISLTLDRFYFSEKIGQKVHNSYSVAYGLLVIFTLLLVIQYAGILKIDLIMQEETKMIWALTPALSLLWKTKFIAFREWDQRQKKEFVAEEPAAEEPVASPSVEDSLDDMEKDMMGEISNISMGTAATTMSSLVNHIIMKSNK